MSLFICPFKGKGSGTGGGTLPPSLSADMKQIIERDNALEEFNVTMPKGAIRVGTRLFNNIFKLRNLTITEGYKQIGIEAFSLVTTAPSGLETITLPQSLTYIGDKAFQNQRYLQNITLPQYVSTLGNEAFRGCIGLNYIIIQNVKKLVGLNTAATASGVNPLRDCTGYIFVDDNLYDQYMQSALWGGQGESIFEGIPLISQRLKRMSEFGSVDFSDIDHNIDIFDDIDIEYIEYITAIVNNSGAKTDPINLGFWGHNSELWSMELDMLLLEAGGEVIVGCSTQFADTDYGTRLFAYPEDYLTLDGPGGYNGWRNQITFEGVKGRRIKVVINNNSDNLEYFVYNTEGEELWSGIYDRIEGALMGGENFNIFGGSDTVGIYGFKLTVNDQLVRDLEPIRKANGEIGFIDNVNDDFYTSNNLAELNVKTVKVGFTGNNIIPGNDIGIVEFNGSTIWSNHENTIIIGYNDPYTISWMRNGDNGQLYDNIDINCYDAEDNLIYNRNVKVINSFGGDMPDILSNDYVSISNISRIEVIMNCNELSYRSEATNIRYIINNYNDRGSGFVNINAYENDNTYGVKGIWVPEEFSMNLPQNFVITWNQNWDYRNYNTITVNQYDNTNSLLSSTETDLHDTEGETSVDLLFTDQLDNNATTIEIILDIEADPNQDGLHDGMTEYKVGFAADNDPVKNLTNISDAGTLKINYADGEGNDQYVEVTDFWGDNWQNIYYNTEGGSYMNIEYAPDNGYTLDEVLVGAIYDEGFDESQPMVSYQNAAMNGNAIGAHYFRVSNNEVSYIEEDGIYRIDFANISDLISKLYNITETDKIDPETIDYNRTIQIVIGVVVKQ